MHNNAIKCMVTKYTGSSEKNENSTFYSHSTNKHVDYDEYKVALALKRRTKNEQKSNKLYILHLSCIVLILELFNQWKKVHGAMIFVAFVSYF